ncbi:MAG: LuxR family transcriptional regulator [Mesorhizobium sp.]|uniref:autoinducer binding domain-containing protein n=1 Tax=Mesorhizobium sp. TaxID=1871066 RepID=UPI000FEA7AC9|nr:autoinducer binding domain-containing protein [Mesorhizobium sp.]RWA75253.1 MAG: LuxR family transcriptional regulator [Mesorhizobium sp.]
MDEQVHALIDAVDLARDERAVRNALKKFVVDCGFERYAYLHPGPTGAGVSSDYPPEWRETYFRNRYSSIDPVVTRAKRLKAPFSWSTEDLHPRRRSLEERRFFAEATDFGIRSGLTIPLQVSFGTVAMLTLASARPFTEISSLHDAHRAATAVAFVHIKLSMLGDLHIEETETRLTAQEAKCLTWSSLGKYMPEIAAILGIEHRTVQYHLDNVREKLGAINLPHAVRIALLRKLLN